MTARQKKIDTQQGMQACLRELGSVYGKGRVLEDRHGDILSSLENLPEWDRKQSCFYSNLSAS